MKVRRFAPALLLALSLPRAAVAENRLVRLEERPGGGGAVIELEGSEPPTFTTTAGEGRLVIDIAAAALWGVPAETSGVGPVRVVRAMPFGTMARVAIELVAGAEADVAVHGNRLEVSVARHLPVALLAPGEARRVEAARAEAEREVRAEVARLAKLDSDRKRREDREAEERGLASRLARLEAEREDRARIEREREEAERIARDEATKKGGERAERPAERHADEHLQAVAEPGAPQEVTHVGFRPRAGGAQVVIRTAAPPRFRIAKREGGVTVVFPRAGIPLANNRRTIDTSFFRTRVGAVKPEVDRRTGEVRIEIDVRGSPEVRVLADEAEVILDFEGAG